MAWFIVALAGVLLAATAVEVVLSRTPERTPTVTPAPAIATGKAEPGETLNVLPGDVEWTCYASAEAFQDLAKWILLDDKKNINKTLRDGHSIQLTAGLQVKIIDADFGRRKVRILDTGDERTGRECWVSTEALAPGSN
ncbi:MAG TPA: hypothetical protein VG273_21390 [Bryobacteraceae bacterium]|jgi:hypothetical protein|nr:hypothetical protein [Bryobacteraceae bacterium]